MKKTPCDMLIGNDAVLLLTFGDKSCSISLLIFLRWLILLFGLFLVAGQEMVPVTNEVSESCISPSAVGLKHKLKRYIIDDERQVTMPLTLIDSDRVSHRLANAIFKKFLKEVVGYQNIEYYDVKDNMKPDMYDPNNEEQSLPVGMVNLEVWIPPGFSDYKSYSIHNLGAQGTGGRFSWFVKADSESDFILDHWRSFQRERVAKHFSLDPNKLQQVKEIYTKDSNGLYYCESHLCKEGMFVPPLCQGNKKCATLFAGKFQYSKFLLTQVVQQKLLVQVAWIGLNLTPQFIERFRPGQPILYFSWWPNPLSVIDGIIPVSFPSCTELDLSLNNTYLCKYELHTLRKHAWEKLEDIAVQAYEAVERFSLRDSDYRYLLSEYNRMTFFNESEPLLRNHQNGWDDHIIDQVACQWMSVTNNSGQMTTWKPSGYDVKPKLWFAGIFPLSDSSLGRYSSKTLVHAGQLAIHDINQNTSILNDYQLELMAENGGCASDVVLFSYIKYIRTPSLNMDHLVGILGPSCSDTVEPLAGISKLLKTVMISYSAEGAIFNDQGKYPYFFRTIPENKLYRYVYLQLFKELKWKQIASLTEDGNKYSEYLTLLQDVLQPENITIFNRKFPREARKEMATYLKILMQGNYKIIIGDFYSEMACEILCEAYNLGMTAKQGYVWFLPRWFVSKWYDTDNKYKDNNDERVSCSTENMLEALDGHFSLGYAYYAPEDVQYHSGDTVRRWKQRYDEYKRMNDRNNVSNLADYAGYTYDAVWTYAFALHKLLKENITHAANMHSNSTNERFVQLLRQTDFMGVSGHISFKESSSRKTIIHISQFHSDFDAGEGSYRVIGRYMPNSTLKYGGQIYLNSSAIEWLTEDGQKPGDGSLPEAECALEAFSRLLNLNCEVTIVITMLIAFLIFAILVAIFIVYKTKYEKVEPRHWQLEHFMNLDEWEIPRERVVINRNIGTGAFGTVYGGECRITDDGPWDAVAVKTLKVGSTIENKLDFLGEAEMMKQFEHKNIIKLIGLATRVEPIFMIMEFMLYGDLKTYLLARRHLVSERTLYNDDDEISNRRLTSMCLDVVCALDYLATNKYVHRDVACRNCLVNADRVVKLSDFGMTRPVYENNYYRYSRKGMLPVRWMAPESLEDGVYTTMTDIWSFGVLLYEIVTFGNFPFQELSNDQVLEYVVQHRKTIKVPFGVRPQLEKILKRCWMQKPEQRPSFGEIMEILSNNPRLIEPCLDVPTASVQTNDVGPDCRRIQQPSLQREISPDQIAETNSVFSSNSVTHPSRPKNHLEGTIEPLLPGDSYVTRYSCLQINRSPPESIDIPPTSITTV